MLSLLGTAGGALVLTACAPAALPTAAATTPMPAEGATAASPTVQAEAVAESATAVALNETITVPAFVVRPEVTEGPYYVDLDLIRSDVREGKAGSPLQLTFNVSLVGDSTCTPMEGALVEIWHCDAEGVYSGVTDPGWDTSNETWLRGGQLTDASGVATFTTIYPVGTRAARPTLTSRFTRRKIWCSRPNSSSRMASRRRCIRRNPTRPAACRIQAMPPTASTRNYCCWTRRKPLTATQRPLTSASTCRRWAPVAVKAAPAAVPLALLPQAVPRPATTAANVLLACAVAASKGAL